LSLSFLSFMSLSLLISLISHFSLLCIFFSLSLSFSPCSFVSTFLILYSASTLGSNVTLINAGQEVWCAQLAWSKEEVRWVNLCSCRTGTFGEVSSRPIWKAGIL
jgi:hypothetical protein